VKSLAILGIALWASLWVSAATYDETAKALLSEKAKAASKILSDRGLIPAEPFTNVTVQFIGRDAQPEALLKAENCSYYFFRGILSTIERTDLFVDKGPESLILLHLTSEALTLNTNTAPAKALDLLRDLGFNIDALGRRFKVAVSDDLMSAYPLRNGGTNFPADLRKWGELLSRKKVKIIVEFIPTDEKEWADMGRYAPLHFEFLATTGELLSARFKAPDLLASLAIKPLDPVTVQNSADFSPPQYASAVVVSPNPDVASALAQAMAKVTRELTAPAKCFLLFDNLNNPSALAAEMNRLAAGVPWAGFGHAWVDNVSFDVAPFASVRPPRGVALLGIAGEVSIHFETLTNFTPIPFRGNTLEALQQGQADRNARTPALEQFLGRFERGAAPDHVFVALSGIPNGSLTFDFNNALHVIRPASFLDLSAANSSDAGVEYVNGAVFTNAIVFLDVGGNFPLQHDVVNAIARKPLQRIAARSVIAPLEEFPRKLAPDPLLNMVKSLGAENIAVLQKTDALEIARLGNDAKPVATKKLGLREAKTFAATLLNPRFLAHYNRFDAPSYHLRWQPDVAFKIATPNQLQFIIDFQAGAIQILRVTAAGEKISTQFQFMPADIGKLAVEAFPTDTALREAAKPRPPVSPF
jgi:hypothetical protein